MRSPWAYYAKFARSSDSAKTGDLQHWMIRMPENGCDELARNLKKNNV